VSGLGDSSLVTDDALAYLAITRLHAAYADVVTRRAWPELEPLFVPDAPIHVDTVTRPAIDMVGAAALGAFIAAAIERFAFFQFVVLNTVVDVNAGGTANGRVFMVELRQDHAGQWSNAFGLYQDAYRLTDDRWHFAKRRYQSLARKIGREPADVFPFPASTPF
jgi:hypothetical protein